MRVLMPLPDRDSDTTEVAVPWQVLTAAGHEVAFVVRDGSYVSARWPGDAYLFGQRFCDLLG
jgi:putative intracellular protease/amidase